ncbi:MAG: quinone-dependent dihydroorotate dehydrogenase [Candidatus Veblenbacteria bacterium]|nr:quinone-dependent dihydroorotate dehydrogenase [Candidatus Veblenbacteria bacterium]
MSLFARLYRYGFKPVAFRLDPEFVHDHILAFGKILGAHRFSRAAVQKLFVFSSPMLEQDILGIHFSNPVGLAAGFDKNAELTDILPAVGFGFAEVGSVTGEPCAGNPKQRLWRLPKSQALVVNYGLKNDGAGAIARRLAGRVFGIPLGISIAKTNSPDTVPTKAGIADYVKAYRSFVGIGSYTTINISCPNAFGGQPFTEPASLDALLAEIDGIPTRKPVFVKLSPDLAEPQLEALIAVLNRHTVHGIVCTNLTNHRANLNIKDAVVPAVGGLSGKVVEPLANRLIAYMYRCTQGKYVIVGCGGVFTAADAYKKIRLGASLIQMITGMVYQGPQVIGEINQGLVKLLRVDGFSNVSEAIGADNKL